VTRADAVVDASVLGAAFFNEEGSEAARRRLATAGRFIAPDLIRLELASLGAKKVRRGEASMQIGERALALLPEFLWEFRSSERLAAPAYRWSAEHQLSAYDAAYLALADQEGCRVMTLDAKLARRATERGLGELVELLTS
jgi:predicted nucleic acid-binding protein